PGRRLRDRLGHARIEDGLDRVRLDPALADVLRPVAGDLVARRELAQTRHLVAAAGRLYVRATRVEAAGRRRVHGAREVAGEEDRLALALDGRIGDRHGREERDRVRVERLVVERLGR